jgi:hypothetical protein
MKACVTAANATDVILSASKVTAPLNRWRGCLSEDPRAKRVCSLHRTGCAGGLPIRRCAATNEVVNLLRFGLRDDDSSFVTNSGESLFCNLLVFPVQPFFNNSR